MRLATITNWAYGATVALTLASAGTMLLASNAHDSERAAVAQRFQVDRASARVGAELFDLTDHARQYLNTGDPTYRTLYDHEISVLAPVEQRLDAVRKAGISPDQIAMLREAMRWTDALHDEQAHALTAYDRGDEKQARQLLFGPEYERQLTVAQTQLQRFRDAVDQNSAQVVAQATSLTRIWTMVTQITLAITGMLFICVLFFIFKRRVLRPVVKLSDVVNRLAAQDYAVEPPEIARIDEIGDIAQAIRVFRETGLERQRLESERDAESARRDLLARLTQRLHGCDSLADLKDVVRHFMPDIAPGHPGRLYIMAKDRNAMVEACTWLDPRQLAPSFSPLSCWAVRRGVPHRSSSAQADVPCEHLAGEGPSLVPTLCLPLTAQRETLGLLCLEMPQDNADLSEPANSYLHILAENLGLALANLNLREALQAMAMADSLTGLANRHQLEATLEDHLEEARASNTPVAGLMIDIDHFKHFNDSYGHDAGDLVLREVGAVLRAIKRESDFAYRLGGEEFLLLLPGMQAEQAAERAAELRGRIAALDLSYEGCRLGQVTVSVGLAVAPAHCSYPRVLQTADLALLRAKQCGRDRVVVAGVDEDSEDSAARLVALQGR